MITEDDLKEAQRKAFYQGALIDIKEALDITPERYASALKKHFGLILLTEDEFSAQRKKDFEAGLTSGFSSSEKILTKQRADDAFSNYINAGRGGELLCR